VAYCAVSDLLIGDIPTSAELDPQKYVNDAADEIDSKIGFVYETPIPTTVPRPVVLLLKRLNAHLASGRLILAATITGEDVRLNAYGQSLVDEVQAALQMIVDGKLPLAQADLNDEVPRAEQTSRVLHANQDAESAVDAFYGRVANPDYYFVSPFGFPVRGDRINLGGG
jgi:phage gp36-like protein